MAVVYLSPVGGAAAQFFDNSGYPLTGGKLYSYEAGTTTPKTSYTSNAGSTTHTNPIVLDAAGRVPGGEVWITAQPYKFVVKTSDEVLIATYDNIVGQNANSYTVQNFTGNGSTTAFILSTSPLNENSTLVYINGVYQNKNTYSLTNSTLTFSEAPPNTSLIEVMFN